MKTPISGDQGIRTILNKNTQQVTNKQHEKAERMEMQYLSRSLSRERENNKSYRKPLKTVSNPYLAAHQTSITTSTHNQC